VFKYADPEAVAVAWAKYATNADVGPKLPEDNTTWAASGFVVVQPVGGSSNIYYPLHAPVITYQTFACAPDSDMPPWWKASNLCEVMRAQTYDNDGVFLELPYRDQNARVLQAYFVTEPRRVFGDLGDYAAYTVSVCLNWTPVPKT
jgi:hypothetical protein